jgi:membrane-bound lytic murein transglycosylase A
VRGVTVLDGVARAAPSVAAAVAALTLAVTGSLAATNASRPSMPASKVTFEPATFADLPGWANDDHLAALKTFLMSCGKVMKAAKARVPESRSSALARACRAAAAIETPTRKAARAFFEAQFVPHRVVHKSENGFLTGYYEPVLKGSRKAEGRFQTPIYRRPPDLVNVVAETQRASKSDGLTHVRQTANGVEPFATRAEIEQGALKGKGLELLYLACPVDTFFMHIQGSGRIELTDGTTVRLNYDGKNGHPYSSIGRYLIAKGLFPADRMSLQALRKWLRADSARGQQVMWQNASFIFFRELEGHEAEGPLGALSVPLTAGRSLAVDTAYHTLGAPIYVAAPSLKHATKAGGFNRLMVAQDVGSAIKGPERGDIYFGTGDKAGRLAGITKNKGTFFALLPLPEQSAAQARERRPWQKTEKAAR